MLLLVGVEAVVDEVEVVEPEDLEPEPGFL